MTEKKDTTESEARQFPAAYEKAIPIALGVIVILIVVALVVAFGVAFGVFHSA